MHAHHILMGCVWCVRRSLQYSTWCSHSEPLAHKHTIFVSKLNKRWLMRLQHNTLSAYHHQMPNPTCYAHGRFHRMWRCYDETRHQWILDIWIILWCSDVWFIVDGGFLFPSDTDQPQIKPLSGRCIKDMKKSLGMSKFWKKWFAIKLTQFLSKQRNFCFLYEKK